MPMAQNAAGGAESSNTPSDDPGPGEPSPALQADVSFSESFVILRFVKPIYPEAELQAGISARLLIAVHVTPGGDIDDQKIQEASTTPPGPTGAFELSAAQAMRKWRIGLPPDHRAPEGYWLPYLVEFTPEEEGRVRVPQHISAPDPAP
jgi:TonB family protein